MDDMYKNDYNVKIVNDGSVSEAPYLQVRYDFNSITFAFRFIGYLAIVEVILTLLHSILMILDFWTLEWSNKNDKLEEIPMVDLLSYSSTRLI